jgi:hypothetical protein
MPSREPNRLQAEILTGRDFADRSDSFSQRFGSGNAEKAPAPHPKCSADSASDHERHKRTGLRNGIRRQGHVVDRESFPIRLAQEVIEVFGSNPQARDIRQQLIPASADDIPRVFLNRNDQVVPVQSFGRNLADPISLTTRSNEPNFVWGHSAIASPELNQPVVVRKRARSVQNSQIAEKRGWSEEKTIA